MLQVSKDSPIPLYQQLLNEIRARIASGEWPADTRPPTENELADELGISRVTVRQAMGAAVEAGLLVRVPGKGTYVARVTYTRPTRGFVGYVVPHLTHSFNVQTLLGVESVLKTEGWQLIFCTSGGDPNEESRLLENLESEGMAGYIIQPIHSETSARVLGQLVARGRPVVAVDRTPPGVQVDSVVSDHFEGGYTVVQHLIEQGYTDIVYLGRRPLELSSIAERLRGYRAAMADAGLAPRPPFVVSGSAEQGYLEVQRDLTYPQSPALRDIAGFLCGPGRPQAVAAMNDLHALLVLEAARHIGVRIPEDMALVGFDDLDLAATLHPPLTTVAQQPFQLGVEAARLLLARIHGEKGPARQVRLPTRLVVRSSSLNPRHQAPVHAQHPSPDCGP